MPIDDDTKNKDEKDEKKTDEQKKADEKKEESTPKYPDDVNALLTKTRLDERNKVKSELEKAKALEDANKLLFEKAARLEAENAEIKKSSEKKEDNSANKDAFTMDKVQDLIKKTIDETAKDFTSRISELEKVNTKLTLDKVRTEAISAANGELVAELVGGNTVEEIEASVIKAKALYAKIVDKVASSSEKTKTPKSPPPANAKSNMSPDDTSNMDKLVEEVGKMNMTDWAKRREEILRKVSSPYIQ